jgi:hypothetical protein
MQISPGKVHRLSARAARLYIERLLVTFGFRVHSHTHRPFRCLAAASCSYGRAFATRFFQAGLTASPLRFTTLLVTFHDHFFSYD